MKKNPKIVVFTGAGISAESGVKTFRDNDGLWENFDVEEVAHIDSWDKKSGNREKMLQFYNMRRKQLDTVEPNEAHKLVAKLEKHFETTVITQNVDDLHERGGSTNVIHLHGELRKMKSSVDRNIILPYERDIQLGDKCPKGSQLRPYIVWFGEQLDEEVLKKSKKALEEADVLVIVGTSLQVYPASSMFMVTQQMCLIYYVDPVDPDIRISDYRAPFFYHHKSVATVGMKEVYDDLMDVYGKED